MAEPTGDEIAAIQGKAFQWHEITTSDQAGSIAFYTGALNFGTQTMEMGEMGAYTMLTRNGNPVCGVTAAQGGTPTHWTTYLSVDDVDARVEKCKALGATLVAGPFDVPTIGRMALIKDPQGATIWLFKAMPM